MSHSLFKACAALLALASFPACAGAPPRPDDAAAPVPETRYRAPGAYRAAEAQAATPDRHWIEANRTVSGYNSMMLTMPQRPAPRAPDPGQAAPQPAPQAAEHGPHAGHGQEGHH